MPRSRGARTGPSKRKPRRWAPHTRNWNPSTMVTLNPERDAVIKAATENLHNSQTAAWNGR